MGASSGGIRAGKAFVEFFADKSPFVRGLRSMEKDLKAFGGRVMSIGAWIGGVGVAVAAAMAPAVLAFAASGDALAKMSQRTGMSVEALSTLKYAAESSGASLEDVKSAVGKVQGDLVAMAKGSWEAGLGLRRIGIDARKLAGMRPEEQFVAIAEQLSKIPNLTLRAAMANEVFGGSAESLLPLINGGAAGIAQYKARLQELNGVMSGKSASAGEQLTQVMTDIQTAVKGVWHQVGDALAPTLIELGTWLATIIGYVSTWVSQNKALIVTVAKIAVAVAVAGAALTAVGGVIIGVGSVFGVLAAAVTSIGVALGAILSPVGLLVTGLIGVVVAFLTLTDTGQQATSLLGEAWATLTDSMMTLWGGVSDAIAAGDLALAGEIVFQALNLAWLKATEGLKSVWRSVTTWLLDAWDTTVAGFASLMTEGMAVIQTGWLHVTDFFADAWDVVWSSMLRVASTVISAIMTPLKGLASVIAEVLGVDISAAVDAFNAGQKAAAETLATGAEKRIGERDATRRKRLQDIEDNRAGAQGEISDGLSRNINGRSSANAVAAAADQAAIQQAKAEYEAALAASAKLKTDAATGKAGVKLPGSSGSAAVIPNLLASAKTSTTGTFSGAAAGKLGGADPMLQQSQEQTRLLRTIANKSPTFG